MVTKYYTLKINLISTSSWIIIFSLLVSPAIAADWVLIDSSKGVMRYVDRQSLRGDTTGMEFWEKAIYKEKQLDPDSGKYFITTREYVEIDCNKSTAKFHEITYYSAEGEVIDHVSFSPPHSFRIIPDSIGNLVEKYVCSFNLTK